MKMRTYHICLLLLALVVISCEDKNSYILKGNIKGLQNSEIYIVSSPNLQVDTIRTKSGKFTYRGVSPTVEPLVIYMENGNAWMTLWVQNGEKFSVTGDANYPELIMVKGGEINKLLSEFKNENLSLIKEKCELRDKLNARSEHLEESSISNDAQLSSQMKNVDQILKTRAQDFIEAHPSSIAALVMIQDYILDIENASDIRSFLDLLAEEVKTNPLYEKLYTRCLKDLQTKVGQPALDFKLTDTKNDTISLETFKGKYLILTFATSQCEFCKPEYDELLAIQNSFPSKELALLTIALDENKEDWIQLAQKEGINWTQVIDSTGWASEMASLYNVLVIPCNYLIDKNGIIIGSKLRAENIQTILNEKLKTKNNR
ncbi:MAG: AhpC/TSA family protein [Candidatus Azobacteroides sp.]|nr:AhpC/TSA family protein [Candidatus Azobacteroides sp.]